MLLPESVREIWQWEWHALIVWGLFAALAIPLLALYLRRGLILLMHRHRTLLRSPHRRALSGRHLQRCSRELDTPAA